MYALGSNLMPLPSMMPRGLAADYHISMYVKDFQPMFERMEALSLIFVNPRFKRKAATLEEAVEQVCLWFSGGLGLWSSAILCWPGVV